MYPEHWFAADGDESNSNLGFSMKEPTYISPGGTTDLRVQTELDHFAFSITMDLSFQAAIGNITISLPLPNGLFYWMMLYPFSEFEISHGIVNSTKEEISTFDEYYYTTNIVAYTWYHISIICCDGDIDLYINGVIVNHSTGPGTFYQPSIYNGMLDINYNGPPKFWKNFKFYNTKISKQQLLDDYYCLRAHYLFDGSGMIDDNYMTEYDASGGISYNATIEGDSPLELTSTGTHIRDYSVSIPVGSSIKNIIPKQSSFFISFWVYFVDGSSNFDLFAKATLSIHGMTEDTGYSLYYKLTENGAQILLEDFLPSIWYMLSIGYDPVDGDGHLHIYINGLQVSDIELVDTAVDLIGDGSMTIYSFPGVLSDYRQYSHILSDEEIMRLYTGNVAVDDKGTFYASKLTEDPDMETFGFGKGEIRAKSFELLEEDNENFAEYDISSGIFRIADFKQV